MKISKITEKFNELRKEIKKLGSEAFHQELKPLFEKYPQVLSVRWNQYTPYFNDGETCEFSVNTAQIQTAENGGFQEYWDFESEDIFHRKPAEEFRDLLSSIEDEIFLITFGDHAEITISRDGTVEVDRCDHD